MESQAPYPAPEQMERGPDGSYRWLYQVNLYRRTDYLFLILKIFFFIWLGIILLLAVISLVEGDFPDASLKMLPAFLLVGAILLALSLVSYYVYALIMGGKYTVLFTMSPKGINHQMVSKEAEKALKVGYATVLTGLLTGQLTGVGAGLLAVSRNSLYTAFEKVNKVKIYRSKGTLKIRSSVFFHNQIYIHPPHFEFVLNFVRQHIPPEAKVTGSHNY